MWKKVVGYGLLAIVLALGAGVAWLVLRKPAQRPAPDIHVTATAKVLARGKMVWTLADCDGCHSGHDPKTFADLAGTQGQGNVIPNSELHEIDVPNITPDRETGIGAWTDGEKMRAIREGVDKDGNALFPMMPYGIYRFMSDDDVYALVAYLDSLPPQHHAVPKMKVKFPLSALIKGAPQPLNGPVPEPDRANRRVWGQYLATVAGCEECHTQSTRGKPDLAKRFAGGQKFDMFGKVIYSANISPDAETGIGSWTLPYFKQRFRAYKDRWPEKFTVMPWHEFAQLPDDDIEAIYYYLNEQKPVANKVNPFRDQRTM